MDATTNPCSQEFHLCKFAKPTLAHSLVPLGMWIGH